MRASELETTVPVGSLSSLARIASGDHIPWAVFCAALGQFIFFAWRTLDQPIVDMWGFRPGADRSYVSVYLFFPELHINNAHYQIENVIFLCAAVAIVVDALLLSRYYVAGYFILAATVAAQV